MYVVHQLSAIVMLTHIGNTDHSDTLKCHISAILDKLLKYFWKRKTNLPKAPDNLCKYMLSGCELIDTENISLPSQNMKIGGE